MSEYVPTTEVVKDACTFPRRRLGEPRNMTPAAFDRWLASVKADVLMAAQQCIAGDLPIDEARARSVDLVNPSGLIHDLDEMIGSLIEEATP